MSGLIPNPTQGQKVIEFIEQHGSINFKTARLIGVSQLAARIVELHDKGRGVQFDKERVKFIDDNGRPGYYKEYSLAIKQGQQEMAL